MNTENTDARMVDQSELRLAHLFVIAMVLTGFIADRWEFVAGQAVIFLLSVIALPLNPVIALYRAVLRPTGIIKPDWRIDNMEAHRFAMIMGIFVAGAAAYCIYAGYTAIGWGIVWMIVALSAFAIIGWCMGCFSYYMMNKMGMKGFFRYSPINNIFPGLRPPKQQ